MNDIYLIAVSATDGFNSSRFHKFIKELYDKDQIRGWWHYISGPTYLVKSELSANQLFDLIKVHTKDYSFIVIQVNPDESQGWLPPKAWKWVGQEQED